MRGVVSGSQGGLGRWTLSFKKLIVVAETGDTRYLEVHGTIYLALRHEMSLKGNSSKTDSSYFD